MMIRSPLDLSLSPFLLLPRHQSFYLTCVYTFIALSALILFLELLLLLRMSSPPGPSRKRVDLVLTLSSIRHCQNKLWLTSRTGSDAGHWRRCWPSVTPHAGILHLLVSQSIDGAAFLFSHLVGMTMDWMSMMFEQQKKSMNNFAFLHRLNRFISNSSSDRLPMLLNDLFSRLKSK